LITVAAITQAQNENFYGSSTSNQCSSPFSSYQNNWGLYLPAKIHRTVWVTPFLKHLAEDQKTFWTSPFRAQKEDAKSSVPFFAFTGLLFASDSWISNQVPDSPGQLKRSQNFSTTHYFHLQAQWRRLPLGSYDT